MSARVIAIGIAIGAWGAACGYPAPPHVGGGSDAIAHDGAIASDAGTGGLDACAPTSPLYTSNGSLYCPFGPGGAALSCTSQAQQCCLGGAAGDGGFADSQCVTSGVTCSNGTNPKTIACETPADCTSGDRCCAPLNLQAPDSCGNLRANTGRTTCEATCGTGELPICASSADCPTAGTQCLPVRASSLALGYCANSEFTVTPQVEPFGTVTAGTSGSATLSVGYNGTAESPAISVAIGGTNTAFSITSTGCTHALPASGTCFVTVTFTPPGAGSAAGTLVVIAGGEPVATALLTGSGQ